MTSIINNFQQFLNECHFDEMAQFEGVLSTRMEEDTNTDMFIIGLNDGLNVGQVDLSIITNDELDFEDLPVPCWFIGSIIVDEDARGQGVFKTLMAKAELEVKKKGGKGILLRPDDASDIPHSTLIKMYKKQGYERYFEGVNYMFKWII